MPTGIFLRSVSPEDDSFLREVYAGTRERELSITGWSDEQIAAFCRMQFDAQDLYYRECYPDASYSVILQADERVGRLYVNRGDRDIRIIDIALLSEYCGRGIGTFLLTDLQAESQAGGRILSIHVEKFNPALKLYERLGFRIVEDKGVYLLLNWSV